MGVTFKEEVEINTIPRHRYDELPRKRVSGFITGKSITLFLLLAKFLVRLFVQLYELSVMMRLREPDLTRYPMFNVGDWPEQRIKYMSHVCIVIARLMVEDGVWMILVAGDFVFHAWNRVEAGFHRVAGDREGRAWSFCKSVLFLQAVLGLWTLKEYALGGLLTLLHRVASYPESFWPHAQCQSFWFLHCAGNLAAVGFLAAAEWLGDLRYFAAGGTLAVFLGWALALLAEPTWPVIRLRYGSGLRRLDPGSWVYELLLGVSLATGFPIEAMYVLQGGGGHHIRIAGYRSFSSLIIDSGLLRFLDGVAPLVAQAFPETSGPEDSEQMLLAAVTHDIGHSMTGQTLWYTGLGYGTLYAGLAWGVLRWALPRPILFRSFGFRTRPAPAVCALVILLLSFWTVWQLALLPLSNAVQWLCEAEADSYAVSLGFGPSLHKFLYAVQASEYGLRHCTSALYGLFYNDHPPYGLRAKWLTA